MTPDDSVCSPATPDDHDAVCRLLDAHGLPFADVAPHLPGFLVARRGSAIVGVVGLEPHGTGGLLRSLCVATTDRGRGLAAALCDRIEDQADVLGLTDLYLLTTTAEGYFTRRGYTVVARDAVPAAIAATSQFASLCPSSAICMHRIISRPGSGSAT